MLETFYAALADAVGTSTAMIAAIGGKGVLILLAVFGAAVIIIFMKIGWRKGWRALTGRT